jgi:aminoglycoside 3-N-acetyltransferase I
MDITVKQLSGGDIEEFREMLRLFAEVFEMKDYQIPDDSYLQQLLKNEGFLVLVALDGKHVIGGLTAHTIPSYYFPSSEMYLYDLAVKTEFQRKGIGTRLLHALKDYCREKGYKEFFVQADESDTHALEFYRSAGGKAERVVHFCYTAGK